MGNLLLLKQKKLTDFNGHQNAQFNDTIMTVKSKVDAVMIAILDSVPYIESNNTMCKYIKSHNKNNRVLTS